MVIHENTESATETLAPVHGLRRYAPALGLLALAATGVLAWIVLGPAGTVALVSTWLLAAGVGRTIPSWRGPVSWAAAIVLEFTIVFGESAASALIEPHPHTPMVYVVILLLPGVLGAVALLVRVRRPALPGSELPPSRRPISLAITAAVLGVAAWVGAQHRYNDVAWAMSGDARNHVAITRGILAQGGITFHELSGYPAAVNTFAAVLSGASARTGTPGEVLLHDVRAIASTYVLAGIAIAVLLAAALMVIVPARVQAARRLPSSVVTVVLVAAAAAGSPLVLGIALADGFLSAYAALPPALAGVVLALRYFASPRSDVPAIALIAVGTLMTFFSWTVLVVVPASLLLGACVLAVRVLRTPGAGDGLPSRRVAQLLSWSITAGGLLTLVAILAVAFVARHRLEEILVLTGTTRSPSVVVVIAISALTLALALVAERGTNTRQMLVPLIAAGGGIVAISTLVLLPGAGISWTYYAIKTEWLVCATLLWVPFAPVVIWLARRDRDTTARRGDRVRIAIAAFSSAIAILLLTGSATTAPEPLSTAARGWNQPSADIVGRVLASADTGTPFVLWKWKVHDPGNDRLGNMWASLAWATDPTGGNLSLPGVKGGLLYWAYMYDTDHDSELCTVLTAVPGITVYTRDTGLEAEMHSICPVSTASTFAVE